jgi:hypothetical protein
MALEKPYVAPPASVAHGMEAVKQFPRQRPVVTLPTVNMVPEQDPRQMIAQQSTPLPPESRFNNDLLLQIIAAENKAGVDRTTFGTGDGKGNTVFRSPQQGRDMDEDEAAKYLALMMEGH